MSTAKDGGGSVAGSAVQTGRKSTRRAYSLVEDSVQIRRLGDAVAEEYIGSALAKMSLGSRSPEGMEIDAWRYMAPVPFRQVAVSQTDLPRRGFQNSKGKKSDEKTEVRAASPDSLEPPSPQAPANADQSFVELVIKQGPEATNSSESAKILQFPSEKRALLKEFSASTAKSGDSPGQKTASDAKKVAESPDTESPKRTTTQKKFHDNYSLMAPKKAPSNRPLVLAAKETAPVSIVQLKSGSYISGNGNDPRQRRKTLDPLTEIEKTRRAANFIQNINIARLSTRNRVPPMDSATPTNAYTDLLSQQRREVDQMGNKVISQLKKSFQMKAQELENSMKVEEERRIAEGLERKRRSRHQIDFGGMVC